jgi:lipoprotein-anchoring transpeptidase ErfK/SrfK
MLFTRLVTSFGRGRLIAVVLVAALAVGVAISVLVMGVPKPPAVTESAPRSAPTAQPTPIATAPVVHHHAVRATGDAVVIYDAVNGAKRWKLGNPGPFDGVLTLQTTGAQQDGWLEVVVPVQPNGTLGWIPADAISPIEVTTHIVIDLSDRTATLLDADVVIDHAPVAVGAPATPSPAISAIVDHIQQNATSTGIYGAWLFGTNQHSEVLTEFDGGRPAIALHGTNQPTLIGQEVSNGCIRFANEDIERFAQHVQLGTRVTIQP